MKFVFMALALILGWSVIYAYNYSQEGGMCSAASQYTADQLPVAAQIVLGRHPGLEVVKQLVDASDAETGNGHGTYDQTITALRDGALARASAEFNSMGSLQCYLAFWLYHLDLEQIRETMAEGLEKSLGLSPNSQAGSN